VKSHRQLRQNADGVMQPNDGFAVDMPIQLIKVTEGEFYPER
jgi:hypothetical protein